MSARIFGIELRRSGALWVGAVLLAVAVAVLFGLQVPPRLGPANWTAHWVGMAVALRFLLAFLFPLILGAGASQATREHRSGIGELLASTPRPVWHRTGVAAGALACATGVGFGVLIVMGAAVVARSGAFFDLAWTPIAVVGLVAVVAAAVLGVGIGRVLPSRLTPPILVLAVFLLSLLAWSGIADTALGFDNGQGARWFLLVPTLAGMRDAWSVLAGSVDAGQGIWFTGLALTGLLLAGATRRRDRLAATLPAVVALLIAQSLLPSHAQQMFARDDAAAQLVCSGRVCVTELHRDRLRAVTAPAESALRRLSVLPDAPSRVEELSAGPDTSFVRPRSAPVVPIWFEGDDDAFRDAPPDTVERNLLAGAGTPPCFPRVGKLMVPEEAARTVVAAWFAGEFRLLPDDEYQSDDIIRLAKPAWDRLRELPAAEQRSRVVAFRAASLSCDDSLLDIVRTT